MRPSEASLKGVLKECAENQNNLRKSKSEAGINCFITLDEGNDPFLHLLTLNIHQKANQKNQSKYVKHEVCRSVKTQCEGLPSARQVHSTQGLRKPQGGTQMNTVTILESSRKRREGGERDEPSRSRLSSARASRPAHHQPDACCSPPPLLGASPWPLVAKQRDHNHLCVFFQNICTM